MNGNTRDAVTPGKPAVRVRSHARSLHRVETRCFPPRRDTAPVPSARCTVHAKHRASTHPARLAGGGQDFVESPSPAASGRAGPAGSRTGPASGRAGFGESPAATRCRRRNGQPIPPPPLPFISNSATRSIITLRSCGKICKPQSVRQRPDAAYLTPRRCPGAWIVRTGDLWLTSTQTGGLGPNRRPCPPAPPPGT